MQSLQLLAPAKVNLILRVGPRRADGFHPILTWMCTVRLFDKLILESTTRRGEISLRCDDPTLPADQTNLVHKAASVLSSELASEGLAPAGVRMTLQKTVPMGAGLGGGSSDAARAIQGLARLWDVRWPIARLRDLSARLGSDIPFFFHAPSALCEGRGEIIRPVPSPSVRWCVLILPGIHMPTPAVYRRFDELDAADRSIWDEDRCGQPDWQALATMDSWKLLEHLVNDLEAPAFDLRPDLADLRRTIETVLSRPVRMSGSGSALFTLFDSRSEADAAAHRLAGDSASPGLRVISTELAPVIRDDLGGNPAT